MTQSENIVNEGVMGNLTTLDPLGRMLQLAGVDTPAETLQEDAASNTIDQLVKSAINLPQYKGNAEAARLYVIGTLLSAIYQNAQAQPFQTVQAQAKTKALTALGAIGADFIKSSQTAVKPTAAQPAPVGATPR
jgi:hypothetical protein